MIKVTNGKEVFTVTSGAYKSIFKNQGFRPVDEVSEEPEKQEEVDEVSEEPEFDVAGLEEKPIGRWSKAELQEYAKVEGIDLDGVTKVVEVRAIVKAHIDEKNSDDE